MRWLKPAAVPLIAVGLALGIGAIVLAVSGANPIEAYGALIDGSLSSQKTIGRTLEKATPLIMGGLAVAFAFRAGLFKHRRPGAARGRRHLRCRRGLRL